MANTLDTTTVTGTIAFAGGTIIMPDSVVTNDSVVDAVISRSKLLQDDAKKYQVPLCSVRVHDAITSFLPSAASADDLGLVGGTFGTNAPMIQSSDAKAATVTQYGRFLLHVPMEYVAGETLDLQVRAGMVTTVSDTTATLDVEAYLFAGDGTVGSDLCTTSAQSINSLTEANYNYTITPTGIEAGDVLDIRLTVAITDSANGTAVIGAIHNIYGLFDVRG